MRRPIEPQLIEFDAGELEIAPTAHHSDKGILVEIIGVRHRVSVHLTYYQAAALRSRLAQVLGPGSKGDSLDAKVGL